MLKAFGFLAKREDLETQTFIDYYENHQVRTSGSSGRVRKPSD
jgi:hypothetical protein